MTIAVWGNWATTVAFLGFVVSILIQGRTLMPDQKKKYRLWLQISLVLVGLGTIAQQWIAYLK
jgi:hypothetical protein